MTVGELKKKLSEYPDDMMIKKLLIEEVKDVVQEFGDACYERGYSDANNYEYGIIEDLHISIDEFISLRDKKVKL